MLPVSKRRDTAEETLAFSPGIISSTSGASSHSTLYSSLLPPLDYPAVKKATTIRVINKDAFSVAETLAAATRPEKVAVLNFASHERRGGTFLEGGLGQEEHLCYRSTLAYTLRDEYYPLLPLTAIWSPNVVVFREELLRGLLPFLETGHRFTVGVISCGGLKYPIIENDDYSKQTSLQLDRS